MSSNRHGTAERKEKCKNARNYGRSRKKTQLIAELTDSTSKILGLPKDIIFVFLKENDPDNIGAGGLPLSAHKKQPAQ